VREEARLEPLTDYSRYKALCEDVLARFATPEFATVTLRPATVCGYSPRQRLDVIVNILTNHAVNRGTITVQGGEQLRPNIHIADMVDAYLTVLNAPAPRIAGGIYNVGLGNFSVRELAEKVRQVVGPERVRLVTEDTNDPRSYRISSDKIAADLGFSARRTIEDAASELVVAFADGRLPNPLADSRYYNVRTMKERGLR
jgi:nucleoside-diphosphate-sugar epimerase